MGQRGSLVIGDQATRPWAIRITANLQLLGIPRQLGPNRSAAEATPGRDGVALWSDSLWRSRFGAPAGAWAASRLRSPPLSCLPPRPRLRSLRSE